MDKLPIVNIRKADGGLIVTVALVTDRVDRYNTVIEPSGCMTDFRNVMVDHNHNFVPTGAKLTNKRIENVTLDDGEVVEALVGDILVEKNHELHDEDGKVKGNLFDWLINGRIFSVSVYFESIEEQRNNQTGFVRFLKWSLRALSFLDTISGQEDSFILNIQRRSNEPEKAYIRSINLHLDDNTMSNKREDINEQEVVDEEVVNIDEEETTDNESTDTEAETEEIAEGSSGSEEVETEEVASEDGDKEVPEEEETGANEPNEGDEEEEEEGEGRAVDIEIEDEPDTEGSMGSEELMVKLGEAQALLASISDMLGRGQFTVNTDERANEEEVEEENERAEWTTAFVNSLPDTSFVVIEPAYLDGDTEDKRARHLPVKDLDGNVDLPHLRNAVARRNEIKPVTDSITVDELRRQANSELMRIIEEEDIADQFPSLFAEEARKLKKENEKLNTMVRQLNNSPKVATPKFDATTDDFGGEDANKREVDELEERRKQLVGHYKS